MVKTILLTVFCFSLFFSAIAQAARGNRGPVTATFFGRIVDAGNNRGIDAASVQVLQRAIDSTDPDRDSLIGGMLTMPNGDFSLENLPLSGAVSLVVSAIGYETYERKLDVKSLGRQGVQSGKDLGNIRLKV